MTITKLRFIDSSKDEKERNKNTVETTITKIMILKLKELLIDAKMFLTLMNKTITKMKQD